MDILNRVRSFLGIIVEDSLYITVRPTRLKKKTGVDSGIVAPEDTILECDWKWDSGVLFGYRRILSGNYIDYFVADTDLNIFASNSEEPPTETAYALLYEPDGTVRRFEETNANVG